MGKLLLVVAVCACTVLGQQGRGTLRGQVSDELGGVIVGANVVVVDAAGVEKTTTTNQDGNFVVSGLAAGKYTLRVSSSGFAAFESADVEVVVTRSEPVKVVLKVTIEQQKVVVNSDSGGLNTEPESNTGAVVLKGGDIEALPDDPDDLEAALQALAGPSAGPNGGQIFIDGFSGGNMPPKESIREIRINQNPFAAEKKSLSVGRGLARIEPESGTLVAFATKHGHYATDGSGDNSPFTTSLVRRMEAPGLEINQLFRMVHDDVYASTAKKQEPFTYGQLSAQGFYFKAR
jgi:hypothetical protein